MSIADQRFLVTGAIPAVLQNENPNSQMSQERITINRETSHRALNKLSVGNRFRLMFGHEVDKSDPGYPEFKRIIDEASGRLTPKDKTP